VFSINTIIINEEDQKQPTKSQKLWNVIFLTNEPKAALKRVKKAEQSKVVARMKEVRKPKK